MKCVLILVKKENDQRTWRKSYDDSQSDIWKPGKEKYGIESENEIFLQIYFLQF